MCVWREGGTTGSGEDSAWETVTGVILAVGGLLDRGPVHTDAKFGEPGLILERAAICTQSAVRFVKTPKLDH